MVIMAELTFLVAFLMKDSINKISVKDTYFLFINLDLPLS